MLTHVARTIDDQPATADSLAGLIVLPVKASFYYHEPAHKRIHTAVTKLIARLSQENSRNVFNLVLAKFWHCFSQESANTLAPQAEPNKLAAADVPAPNDSSTVAEVSAAVDDVRQADLSKLTTRVKVHVAVDPVVKMADFVLSWKPDDVPSEARESLAACVSSIIQATAFGSKSPSHMDVAVRLLLQYHHLISKSAATELPVKSLDAFRETPSSTKILEFAIVSTILLDQSLQFVRLSVLAILTPLL